jgi:hypothetical protein
VNITTLSQSSGAAAHRFEVALGVLGNSGPKGDQFKAAQLIWTS